MNFCDEPLGLPKGSIRAILSLGIVFSSLVALLLGKVDIEMYMILVSVVLGFYFGTKGNGNDTF